MNGWISTDVSCPAACLQFNVDDEDAHPVKWYKNFKFWTAVASVLITELLLISAVIMLVRFKHYKVVWFEWWRWLFFFSGRIITQFWNQQERLLMPAILSVTYNSHHSSLQLCFGHICVQIDRVSHIPLHNELFSLFSQDCCIRSLHISCLQLLLLLFPP